MMFDQFANINLTFVDCNTSVLLRVIVQKTGWHCVNNILQLIAQNNKICHYGNDNWSAM